MVEVYKCLNYTSPPFIWNYFLQKNIPYILSNTQLLTNNKTAICNNAEAYGLNTALFKGLL